MGYVSGGESSSVQTIKNHILTLVTGVTTDAWTDFEGFTNVASESNGSDLELLPDNKTIRVNRAGLYLFGGCVHVQNNSVGIFTSTTILTRVIKNTTESRCSQRGKIVNIASGGEDVLSYGGTAYLNADDELKLQYYTDQASLEFYSSAEFQEQVASTIWLVRQGDF